VISREIAAWKIAAAPDIDRKPTVFLILADSQRAAKTSR
jgi:hypothetical protein